MYHWLLKTSIVKKIFAVIISIIIVLIHLNTENNSILNFEVINLLNKKYFYILLVLILSIVYCIEILSSFTRIENRIPIFSIYIFLFILIVFNKLINTQTLLLAIILAFSAILKISYALKKNDNWILYFGITTGIGIIINPIIIMWIILSVWFFSRHQEFTIKSFFICIIGVIISLIYYFSFCYLMDYSIDINNFLLKTYPPSTFSISIINKEGWLFILFTAIILYQNYKRKKQFRVSTILHKTTITAFQNLFLFSLFIVLYMQNFNMLLILGLTMSILVNSFIAIKSISKKEKIIFFYFIILSIGSLGGIFF